MYRRPSDSDLISSLLLHFVWTAEWAGQGGVGMSEQDGAKDDQLFLYLLGSPDPSHLMMTECHHHRRVTSHSPSSGFPGPGSWWTACLWEGPPLMLEEGKRGPSVTIQSIVPEPSDCSFKLVWKPVWKSLKTSVIPIITSAHLVFHIIQTFSKQTTLEFNYGDQSMACKCFVLYFVFVFLLLS